MPYPMNDDRESYTKRSASMRMKASLSSISFAFDAFRDAVPPVRMNKTFWEPPKYHDDISLNSESQLLSIKSGIEQREEIPKHHRAELWYELFYDLVYAAGAIEIGHILSYDINLFNLAYAGVLFLVLRATWDHFVLYQNRFDTNDVIHYLYYLLQALAAFEMVQHTSDEYIASFAFGAAIARYSSTFMYAQVLFHTNVHREYFIATIISLTISASLFTAVSLSNTLQKHTIYLPLFILALFIENPLVNIYYIIRRKLIQRSVRPPTHVKHLINRHGQFLLIILGEAIIQLSHSPKELTPTDYVRSCMGFAIVYSLGDCYYQQQIAIDQCSFTLKASLVGYLWEAMHVTLSLSILYFASGMTMVYSTQAHFARNVIEEYFMCISCGVTLMQIFVLRMMPKGFAYNGGSGFRQWAYAFRVAITVFICIIPAISVSATLTIIILFVFTIVLLFQDAFTNRKVDDFTRVYNSVKLSLSKKKQAASEGGEKRDSLRISYIEDGLSTAAKSSVDSTSFGRNDFLRGLSEYPPNPNGLGVGVGGGPIPINSSSTTYTHRNMKITDVVASTDESLPSPPSLYGGSTVPVPIPGNRRLSSGFGFGFGTRNSDEFLPRRLTAAGAAGAGAGNASPDQQYAYRATNVTNDNRRPVNTATITVNKTTAALKEGGHNNNSDLRKPLI